MEPWKAQSDTKSGRGNARNQGLRAMQSFLGELLTRVPVKLPTEGGALRPPI